MNFLKISSVTAFSVALILSCVAAVGAQNQSTALERGYRTGYSDGYNAGFRDSADKAARDYKSKEEYQRADRSFNDVWGPIEDYHDGYQQGYESGYSAGYDRKEFDSTIPTGFHRRNLPDSQTNSGAVVNTDSQASQQSTDVPVSTVPVSSTSGRVSIPRNTILSVELLTPLSTDATQRGDRFQAQVKEPAEFAGAIIEGRVTEVKRPGKTKGVGQIQLSFDQIRYADNRTAEFHASLVEVVAMGGHEIATVDSEGGIRGRDSTKDDVAKVGAASGIGAVIGAIAGGGHGAAVGAVIGGGAGTAGVMTQRGKEIRLDRGQILRIKTSTDTGIL